MDKIVIQQSWKHTNVQRRRAIWGVKYSYNNEEMKSKRILSNVMLRSGNGQWQIVKEREITVKSIFLLLEAVMMVDFCLFLKCYCEVAVLINHEICQPSKK